MPDSFSLHDFPSHLRELVTPILSFINEHTQNVSISEITDFQDLLTTLVKLTAASLSENSDETSIHPNVFVLIGRLAQELDYPPSINEFFRNHEDQLWLSPFIADWYFVQNKLQDSRRMLDSHLEKIKTEIESLTELTIDNGGKIQAYLESLRIKALIQQQLPDKSAFTLTLRKAMTFLEKLKERSKELKNTWASYALRFSAVQLSAELSQPDLDIIEAIERNVGEILAFTEDSFSKLQFWMIMSKSLAKIKNYHKLEEILFNAWQSTTESASIRMTEEIMHTFAWFTLLRLDVNTSQETLNSLHEQLIKKMDEKAVFPLLLRNITFFSTLSTERSPDIIEIIERVLSTPDDRLIDFFFKLHLMAHVKKVKEEEFVTAFQEFREKITTHEEKWLELCMTIFELKWHLLNKNVGKFKERLEEIQRSHLYSEIAKHAFFKLQALTLQAIAELSSYWSPHGSFEKEVFADLLQQASSILFSTNIPELEAIALQFKTLSHLIKEEFNQIFSLAREIKEFNRDLLKEVEKKKYNLFIAQMEWLEREIAINETPYVSILAEPPSPDSTEALRVLFFNDDYKITTALLGLVARLLRQLFTLDFTLLTPNSLAFDVVESFFSG